VGGAFNGYKLVHCRRDEPASHARAYNPACPLLRIPFLHDIRKAFGKETRDHLLREHTVLKDKSSAVTRCEPGEAHFDQLVSDCAGARYTAHQ
jgi:hypothetical protein